MLRIFDDVWLSCQNNYGNFEKFSLCIFNKFHFNFHLSQQWPFEKIKNALAINLCATPVPDDWNVYALTTQQCDISAYINNFPRDQYGMLGGFEGAGIYACYDSFNHIFRIYDFAAKKAAVIHRHGNAFSEWEQHSPLRDFWHLWALHNNALLIHSGVICDGGKAVLLPGAGGSGKSTTVLSCLQNGLKTTGDDYNLLFDDGEGFCAAPLYGNIKTKNSASRLFDFQIMSTWEREAVSYAEKTIYYPPAKADIWDVSGVKLVGILCPNITANNMAGIGNIKPVELINKLAVSSIMQSPFMAQQYLAKAGEFARKMKVANLNLSPNPNDNAACIRKWLKEA